MVTLSAVAEARGWCSHGTADASFVAHAKTTPAVDYDEWHFLSGPLDEHWALRKPEPARVFFESVEYVASFGPVPILGYGRSVDLALADLRSEIVEHFLWLERERARLAPPLDAERRLMNEILRPRDVG